jgi:hypothetical protein
MTPTVASTELARVDARLGGVVYPHPDQLQVGPLDHVA